MPRTPRTRSASGWYHVMNRGADRRTVFVDEIARVDFGRLLAIAHATHGVEIHGYCLMGNHFHLLLRADAGVSEFMHDLSASFTRHLNDRLGRDGALFRGRYHSVPVESDAHLMASIRYLHRNPLDLPGVERADQYRWSSHRTYLGHRQRPDWLSVDSILEYFGHDLARFASFVDDDLDPAHNRRPALHIAADAAAERELRGIIELIGAELDDGSGLSRAAVSAAAVLLAVQADSADGAPTDGASADAASARHAARRAARSRARRLAAADPRIAVVVERANALLAS